jgi:prepilin-type N-terminal cleavage/methylation domain-containing protein
MIALESIFRHGICLLSGIMKTIQQKKKAFTLVEILLVVTIIALLSAASLPALLRSFETSKKKIKQRNIANIQKAKSILQLPSSVHDLGMGLPAGAEYGADFTEEELFACLRGVEAANLIIDGTPIIVGNIGEQARYPDSSAASNP